MKQANKEKSMRYTLFFTLLILAFGLSGCGTQFGLSKKMAPDEYVEYDPTKAAGPPAVPLPAGFRSDGSRGVIVEGSVTIGGALYSNESPSIVIIGDSIVEQNEMGTIGAHDYFSEVGWFHWANALLRQRFNVLNIAGFSGQKTPVILANLQTEAISYNPKYCLVQVGTNDVQDGDEYADIVANLSSIVSTLKSAAITPILCTLPPNHNIDTSAENIVWHNVNRWMQEHSQSDGFYLFDFGNFYIDASGAYPVPLAGYTDASVHPTPKAAYQIGKNLAVFLDGLYPQTIPWGFTSNSDPKSHLSNPIMLGSGGTASTGASGDVADGFTATGTNCAVVCAKVSRADSPGEWQELTISSATADGAMGRIYQVGAAGTGAALIGQQVYGIVEIKVGAGITNPDGIYASIEARDNASGVIETISLQYHPSGNDEITTYAEGDTFLLKSPLMTVPAETWTLRVFGYFKVDTGGSGTVYVGQAGIVLP